MNAPQYNEDDLYCMGFGHQMDMSYEDLDKWREVLEWARANCVDDYHVETDAKMDHKTGLFIDTWYFLSKDDALRFKMMWK